MPPTNGNFAIVVANLKNRENARPRTIKTLTSTIGSLFKQSLAEHELAALVQQLQASGKVSFSGNKVTYSF
jgi:hypothetical protein